jgi:D-alanyl-D-alanine carboxypeptidase/D-alanyl-D-alanine-endopeptidase (penicillin-binding protein 4)
VRPTRIVVDDALFSGPGISPAWAPEDVPSTYASAITALMADGGRDAPGDALRSASPELAVGHELAAALGQPHLQVVRGRAPAGAPTLASVRSAPLATLVAETLATSDNVLAECLARQVAIATGHPPSFAGAAAAVRAVLKRLGVDPGDGMVDGSGLAASDRVSAATLVGVLRLAAGPAHPELHRVATALPLAAWSGTLAGRYLRGASQAGAGVVRAKTGTLTGVSTLAGLVHDRDGRLLIFALLAHQVPSTPAADAALDVVAARLAGCGCP